MSVERELVSKVALITGITGQDGALLAEFLLLKGYTVHGLRRRVSIFNTERLDALIESDFYRSGRLVLHYGDMTDASSLMQIVARVRPEEVYNLAAQSHVAVSFEEPVYTGNADALGTMRLLEALRSVGLEGARFYQASTSELFGKVQETPQTETTPFYPRSPYAVAKIYAYWATVNYRESYGMFACNGILFNHESATRGETFVTRKITRGLARVRHGMQPELALGNLDARRDWGHARDFVEAQWLMLQQDEPEDFVIASGEQHSVREFVNLAATRMGFELSWSGSGSGEYATDETGRTIVRVDPGYYRPAEVETLLGDASKARAKMGWQPKISFGALVDEMVENDLRLAHNEFILLNKGRH